MRGKTWKELDAAKRKSMHIDLVATPQSPHFVVVS
jgi:hypothetical protein